MNQKINHQQTPVSEARSATARRPLRRRRGLVVGAAIVATIGFVLAAGAFVARDAGGAAGQALSTSGDSPGVAEGFVPDDAPLSPFDTSVPALAKLDVALLHAVQQAGRGAEADGVRLFVASGWRSRSYQQHLLERAVVNFGSKQEALRHVATPEKSHHVTGDAVDIGPTDADSWLSQHGARYGLCQTLANEIWHYELATTPGGECPEMLSDASG
jgi:hypothetical protein